MRMDETVVAGRQGQMKLTRSDPQEQGVAGHWWTADRFKPAAGDECIKLR